MTCPGSPSAVVWGGLVCLLLLDLCMAQGDASKHVPGLDMTKANLNTTLKAMKPEQKVLFEFYATWCPACRNFKPEYDKVANFFSLQPAGPKKVVALRLDCAVDPDVCGQYQVASYPTMYAGTAGDLAAVDVSKLAKFDYGKYSRNAKGVVKFVAETFRLEVTYVDLKEEGQPIDTSTPGRGVTTVAVDLQWTHSDVQLATIHLFESIAVQDILHSKDEQRAALTDLLAVWAATHPVSGCQSGATEALAKLPDVWPEGKAAASSDLKAMQVCGACSSATSCTGAPTPEEAAAALAGAGQSKAPSSRPNDLSWVACKGSKPEQRGYTCALWLLFHTTAARLQDGQVALFMSHMKGFAHQFFQCEVCKRHFERLVDSKEAAAVKTRRSAVLWLWRAHNEVNERLAVIERKYGHSSTGDAAYPKVQWPTKSACPQCRLPTLEKKSGERGGLDGGRRTGESLGSDSDEIKWNEEELYRFLIKWYGGEPGNGTPEDLAAGPASLGHAEDEETLMLEGESGSSSVALFGNAFNVAAVVAIAAVACWVYKRSQRHKGKGSHVKGPGALHHKGHAIGHGPAHGAVHLPKHGASANTVRHNLSNGDSWHGHHSQRKDMN